MDPFQISFLGALGAGVLSFGSPCILPLIPAYISFLGGASLDQLTAKDGIDKALARRVFFSAFAFVLGFSTIFITLGASATALSRVLAENMDALSKIGGVIIIIFGLHFMGLFRIGFLNFEKRFHMESRPSGMTGAYVLGIAFALGWTPCVGPILATILMVAAGGDSVWDGVYLLSAYSAGIGIPFMIAAFAVRPFMSFMRRFRKHMHKVEVTIGVLMIITGVAIFTGTLAEGSQWLLNKFPIFTEFG